MKSKLHRHDVNRPRLRHRYKIVNIESVSV